MILPERNVLRNIDGEGLNHQLAAYPRTQVEVIDAHRVIATDATSVRGARTGHDAQGTTPHQLVALDHATGAVLGQVAQVRRTFTNKAKGAPRSSTSSPP